MEAWAVQVVLGLGVVGSVQSLQTRHLAGAGSAH